MGMYEYRVIPAPNRGQKAKGLKTADARFAFAIEDIINKLAEDGWEYQRADMLPNTERAGFTSTETQWRNLLVFRRPKRAKAEEPAEKPKLLNFFPANIAPSKYQEKIVNGKKSDDPKISQMHNSAATEARVNLSHDFFADNGVENTGNMQGVESLLARRAALLRQKSAS